MDLDKRGRGRGRGGRGARGRGRGGRGRGRGKKPAAVISSDEETSLDQSFEGNSNAAIEDNEVPIGGVNVPLELSEDIVMHDMNKDNDFETANVVNNEVDISTAAIASSMEETKPITTNTTSTVPPAPLPPPTVQQLDMEADISQLEAPTFTTISRGPPEPMLRLKWNHKVSLIGEKVLNPMIHCCDQCEKPILVYGRMIPCKHVFCLKCARTEPVKLCLRCNDKVVRVEQSGLGTVFMCTHGGSRYGNTGCRRTYLSQRDLQAHINHRHVTQLTSSVAPTALPGNIDIKPEVTLELHKPAVNAQRKLSDAASNTTIQAPSTLLTQRPRVSNSIGTIPPPGAPSVVPVSAQSTHSALTQANLARINNANAQDCHQGKVALHHTLKKTPITQSHNQPPETVADASYYSSVLNSFGSAVGGNSNTGASVSGVNPNSAAAVGYSFDSTSQPKLPSQSYQYYR